ncbi:MAG: hypothetical protein Q8P07_02120 [bacterium]|nr:hypothetical protein [bacterium]
MREYKGIILYNAGPAKDESAWQEIFVEVDWNSLWLSLCIGADAGWVARARPVILYSESLFVAGVKAGGINDQIRIYISDKRSRDSFSHEWLHSYLFLAKDYPAGDIFHADPLWKTCGFI